MAIIINQKDANRLVLILYQNCPTDTKNLRDHGIGAAQVIANGFQIIIGEGPQYYAPYTNAEMLVFKTNKGNITKPNPNAGWVNRSIDQWAGEITQKYKGKALK